MTNPMRGQVEIELGGKSRSCRLTVDSLIKIETELDRGILAITQKLSEADIRLNDLCVILLYAMRGGGNDLQLDDVKKVVQQAGIVQACQAVAELLTLTLSDPEEEAEEKKVEAGN